MVLLADGHQSACMINYVIVTVVLCNQRDFVPLTVSNAVHTLGLAAPLVDDLSSLGRLALLFLLELLGGLLPQQKLQCAISKKKFSECSSSNGYYECVSLKTLDEGVTRQNLPSVSSSSPES